MKNQTDLREEYNEKLDRLGHTINLSPYEKRRLTTRIKEIEKILGIKKEKPK